MQVVLGVITCPLALLLDFDVDSCAFCYIQDADRVCTTGRGLRALRTSVNILDTNFASGSYMRRLEKYAEPGPYYMPRGTVLHTQHSTKYCVGSGPKI